MPRTPFESREWDLTEAQRAEVLAIKNGLTEIERVRAGLAAIEAQLHAQAYKMAVDTLLAMPGRPSSYEVPIRSMAADLASSAHVSDTTVRGRMESAARMIQLFPAVHQALCESTISPAHARVICDEGLRLDDPDVRARYTAAALRLADTTPAKLRRICLVVAERLEPTTLDERHEAAAAGRAVWTTPAQDGMTEIHLLVETALAEATLDRITELARGVLAGPDDEFPDETLDGLEQPAAAPDTRTLAQARADVVMDLLLTATPAAAGEGLDQVKATVQITIPAETLLGDGDEPARTGSGAAIAPATARRIAAATPTWARLFHDPATGALTAVDSYTPTAEQRRFLHARDEHCRFPGCRRPIRRCDLDHIHDHAHGGPTDVCNLAGLCRAHHILKHHGNWAYRHLGNGLMEWTSPTGSVVREQPSTMVRFLAATAAAPDADPPPF